MLERKIADAILGTWLDQAAQRIYATIELSIMKLYNDPELIRLIKDIRKEDPEPLFKPSELITIYYLASAQKTIPGDYAEVGVYRGNSAKIICEAKGEKPLYLFDTFSGIPYCDQRIDNRFLQRMFIANYQDVKKRLSGYPETYIYKGVFPSSAILVERKRFAFVHLDVDTHQSTVDSLHFFYQKLNSGGIILSHDYPSAAGVKRAFDEFFKDKPEAIAQLPLAQCMVIKQ